MKEFIRTNKELQKLKKYGDQVEGFKNEFNRINAIPADKRTIEENMELDALKAKHDFLAFKVEEILGEMSAKFSQEIYKYVLEKRYDY